MPETCENCKKTIKDNETAHLFKNHIVCTACIRRLNVDEADAKAAGSHKAEEDLVEMDELLDVVEPAPAPSIAPMMRPMAMAPVMQPVAAMAAPLQVCAMPRQAQAGPKTLNILGLIGLIFSILSLPLSWVPIINWLMAVVGWIGMAFAIVGLIVTWCGVNWGKTICWVAIGLGTVPTLFVITYMMIAQTAMEGLQESMEKASSGMVAETVADRSPRNTSNTLGDANRTVNNPSALGPWGINSVKNSDVELRVLSCKAVDRTDPSLPAPMSGNGQLVKITMRVLNKGGSKRTLTLKDLESNAILLVNGERHTSAFRSPTAHEIPVGNSVNVDLYFSTNGVGRIHALWFSSRSLDTIDDMGIQLTDHFIPVETATSATTTTPPATPGAAAGGAPGVVTLTSEKRIITTNYTAEVTAVEVLDSTSPEAPIKIPSGQYILKCSVKITAPAAKPLEVKPLFQYAIVTAVGLGSGAIVPTRPEGQFAGTLEPGKSATVDLYFPVPKASLLNQSYQLLIKAGALHKTQEIRFNLTKQNWPALNKAYP